jgi:hypothetical protein
VVQAPSTPDPVMDQADLREPTETKLILEIAAALATLIMLALTVADWVLKFL